MSRTSSPVTYSAPASSAVLRPRASQIHHRDAYFGWIAPTSFVKRKMRAFDESFSGELSPLCITPIDLHRASHRRDNRSASGNRALRSSCPRHRRLQHKVRIAKPPTNFPRRKWPALPCGIPWPQGTPRIAHAAAELFRENTYALIANLSNP